MESSLLSLHAVYPSLLNPKFPRISFPPSDSKAGFSSSSIPLLNPYFSFPIFTISVSLSYISLSTSNQQHQSPNLNSGVCFPSPPPQTHISSLPRCFPMLVSAREGEVPMYLSEKPLPAPIDFYKEEGGRDMLVEIVGNGVIHPQSHQQLILGESSGEDHELRAPKKRAETWVQEEIRCLINLRIEMDSLFNTSKSNRHLWEQISSTMRDKGFDRSPTMCTDKWRNLLKEYKKTKHQERGALSAKMSYFKELEELLRERSKNVPCKSPTLSKVDPFIHFTDKGLEDTNIPFGQAEGGDSNSYGGRIITVKWGDFTRRIGIDGTADAIKEAIKSAFGLRTQRAFWLEDEDEVIRSLDRDMPVGTYTLHLDDGITIKVCFYDESDRIPVRTEEKTLYTEDDFRRFLSHRAWVGLRELSGFRSVDTMDELRPGGLYQGVRMLGD